MNIRHYIQLFCILLASFLVFPYKTWAADPYTIDNIAITAKGSSATEASQAATTTAEKQAFSVLLERMGTTSTPNLSPEEISSLVSGMEVSNEKITPGYYSAIMSISFNPNLVKDKLRSSNIQQENSLANEATDAPASIPNVLILPLLSNDQNIPVITEEDAWYQSWKNILSNISSMNIQLASPTDQFPLLANYLKTPNATPPRSSPAIAQELLNLKKHYNVSFIVAATAYTIHTFSDIETASYMVDLSNDTPSPSLLFPSDSDIATGIEHDYHTMASQMSDYLAKEIAKRTNAEASEIVVTIPITNLEAWLAIQRQLSAIDLINKLTLEKISAQQAIVHIDYSVPYVTLTKRLAEASFTINTTSNGLVLSKTSSPTPSSPFQPNAQ